MPLLFDDHAQRIRFFNGSFFNCGKGLCRNNIVGSEAITDGVCLFQRLRKSQALTRNRFDCGNFLFNCEVA